jgi:hypothetical protein
MRHAGGVLVVRISVAHWFDEHMSAADGAEEAFRHQVWLEERRSRDRAASYLFRMSHDDKRRLQARAHEAGMTVQGYLEHLVLGREAAPPRRSGPKGRRPREIQEDLGISA